MTCNISLNNLQILKVISRSITGFLCNSIYPSAALVFQAGSVMAWLGRFKNPNPVFVWRLKKLKMFSLSVSGNRSSYLPCLHVWKAYFNSGVAIYNQGTWDLNLLLMHVWQLYFNLEVMVIPLKNFTVPCANPSQHTGNKDYRNKINDIIWFRVVRLPQNLYKQICPVYL